MFDFIDRAKDRLKLAAKLGFAALVVIILLQAATIWLLLNRHGCV